MFPKTNSFIDGNKQVEVGSEFHIDHKEGFLIVAYPKGDEASGDFSFEYWVDAYKKGDPAPPPRPPKVVIPDSAPEAVVTATKTPEPKEDQMMFFILCGAAGVIALIIIGICTWFCKKRKQNKVELLSPG